MTARAPKPKCDPGQCSFSWKHGVKIRAPRNACIFCDTVAPRPVIAPERVEPVPPQVQRRYREGS